MEVAATLESVDGEALECCIKGLELFASAEELRVADVPGEEVGATFVAETTGEVFAQLSFDFPRLTAQIRLELVARFVRADDHLVGELKAVAELPADASSACVRCGCGPGEPGFWQPGEYRLELFCKGRFVARRRFQMVSAPLALRLGNVGFLTDASKRYEYGARLQWTFVQEETPAIQAWATLGFEALARPHDAEVLACVKWADGEHEHRQSTLHVEPGQTWAILEVELGRGRKWPCGPCWVRLRVDGKWLADSAFDVIPRQNVLRTRPRELMPIEPELRKSPPRRARWVSVGEVSPQGLHLMEKGTACPGWIVSVDQRAKYGDPDYAIVFAYEVADQVRTGFAHAAYDLLHWEQGQPKSYWWFQKNIRRGKPVTILLADDGETAIYGLLDAYLLRRGRPHWAAGSSDEPAP